MASEQQQQHQLQSLTDFWKEPWTASTWGTWSNQNPAAQGLQASSWMYTSRASTHHDHSDGTDFDIGSFSSDCTSFSTSSTGVPSPGASPPTLRNNRRPSSNSNGLIDYHHHHHRSQLHHHPGASRVASSPSPGTTMSPPPGLSPDRYGRPTTLQHATHSFLAAPRALGGRPATSRSSSVESESSALGLYGSGSTAVGGSAFQIAGYRTVELLPTAQQRQTLQKWFGVVRWTHNRAVDALRVDPSASASELRAAVAKAEAEHEWAAAVPLAIRDATVAQLVGALHLAQRSAEVAAAATGESVMAEPIGTAAQNKALKYRTRKDRLEQVVLRAEGFQFGIPYPDYFGYAPLASSAPIPDRLQTDAILVRSTERFYLCIPDTA